MYDSSEYVRRKQNYRRQAKRIQTKRTTRFSDLDVRVIIWEDVACEKNNSISFFSAYCGPFKPFAAIAKPLSPSLTVGHFFTIVTNTFRPFRILSIRLCPDGEAAL